MRVIPTDDLYAVLGVPPDADGATIRRAYRKLMRQLHPDGRPEHERDRAHQETVKLSLAFEFLTDPVKRWDYDSSRKWTPGRPTDGAARPRYEPPPRPPPPRVVVQTPTLIDFGTVYVGQRAPQQTVTLRFCDGSRISCARILNESGPFWYTGPAIFRDLPSIDIRVFGQPMPLGTLLGPFAGRLRVQVDEVTVTVHLKVNVEATPPTPTPAPSAVPTPAPVRPSGAWPCWLLLPLVVVVILVVGIVVSVSGHSAHQAASSAQSAPARGVVAGAPTSKYCSVASSGGQVLSYYLTRPDVAQQAAAGQAPIWSVMAPTKGDAYIAWWTPDFPYWERANQYEGLTQDGQTYGRFKYVEVLPYWSGPWIPLAETLFQYPDLNAATEAAQRKLFIREWSKELGSPRCS